MKRCDQHVHPLVFIEGTVNGDPWVCAECAYRTALSLSRELDDAREAAEWARVRELAAEVMA